MFDTIKKLVTWTGSYKSRLYIGYVFSFFMAMFTAMPIVLAAYGINLVIMDFRGHQELTSSNIILIMFGMIGLVLLRFVFSYLRSVWQDSIAYEQTAGERIRIGDILKRVSLGFFSKNSTGEISSAVTTDLSYFELYSMKMLDTAVNGYLSAAVMILMLIFFSPLAALIMTGGLILSMIALRFLSWCSRKNSLPHQKSQEKMISSVIEYLRGISVVKSFNYEGVASQSVKNAFENHRDINIKIELDYAITNGFHRLALKMASAGVILAASIMTLNGQMEMFVMLMILMFSFVMFSRVEEVNGAVHVFSILEAILNKLDDIEDAEFIDTDSENKEIRNSSIEFSNVSFSYDNQNTITDVSFNIPEKSVTAIVGPSGGGKTTLTRLMARFYDVNSGSITIGKDDIREFTCDSLLNNFSMVFQNVYLFRDTIANNIKFGKPDATEDEIIQAAKEANCHEFISALPNGYETIIGDGGSTLSGGEKQRVSIARAILKDAPIVILDEATASIDPENEHAIQMAIGNLVENKTLIVIAHRLATIKNADQILVLEGGRLIEQGTHDQLMDGEGLYRRFWDIRSQAEDWQI